MEAAAELHWLSMLRPRELHRIKPHKRRWRCSSRILDPAEQCCRQHPMVSSSHIQTSRHSNMHTKYTKYTLGSKILFSAICCLYNTSYVHADSCIFDFLCFGFKIFGGFTLCGGRLVGSSIVCLGFSLGDSNVCVECILGDFNVCVECILGDFSVFFGLGLSGSFILFGISACRGIRTFFLSPAAVSAALSDAWPSFGGWLVPGAVGLVCVPWPLVGRTGGWRVLYDSFFISSVSDWPVLSFFTTHLMSSSSRQSHL